VLPRSTDDVDIVGGRAIAAEGNPVAGLTGCSGGTSHGSSTWIYPGPDSQRGRRRRSDRIAQRPTEHRAGAAPRSSGALVIKAAALTEIATRTDPARDWQDASLLLTMIPDPVAVAQLCTRRDRRRLQGLTPLLNRSHVGWAPLTEEHYRRGAPRWTSSWVDDCGETAGTPTGPPTRSPRKGAIRVELRGLEPLTPSMPWRCATNCATAPCHEAGRA
jgi:hypothetical protein